MAVTKCWGRTFIILGGTQLVLSLVLIICTFVRHQKIPSALQTPVYAGFPYLLAAVMGILVGARRKSPHNKRLVIAALSVNVIMCIFMICVFAVTSIAILLFGSPEDIGAERPTELDGLHCGYIYSSSTACAEFRTVASLGIAIDALCFLASCLSLGCSIIGCVNACCTSSSEELSNNVTLEPLEPPFNVAESQ